MGCSGSKQGVADPSMDESKVGSLKYNLVTTHTHALTDEYDLDTSKVLGSAAMGCVVRKATRKTTGQEFACKTFLLDSAKTKADRQAVEGMLKNEIELLRSLDHPNIVRAYKTYENLNPPGLHLVMELCRGGDLSARKCSEREAASVIRQCLSAISYCHSRGICHRDIKFENILWASTDKRSEIKLIDFGMSARFRAGVGMTQRVGTVYTMAPEVLEGQYSEKCDMWSVGCIAFHLLAGESPFECQTEEATMKRLMEVKYFWPPGMRRGEPNAVSLEAKEFVYNLLKYNPDRRWDVTEAVRSPWMQLWFGDSDTNRLALVSNVSAAGMASMSHTPTSTSREVKVDADPDGTAASNACASQGGSSHGRKDHSRRESLQRQMVNSMHSFASYGPLKQTVLMILAHHLESHEISQVRAVFQRYDSDNTGTLSWEEFSAAMKRLELPDDTIAEIYKSVDVTKNEKIDYLEFLASTIESLGTLDDGKVKEVFEQLDADGSGYISKENLRVLLGADYSKEKVDNMIKEADFDNDGQVNLQEFKELMRRRSTVQQVQALEEVRSLQQKASQQQLLVIQQGGAADQAGGAQQVGGAAVGAAVGAATVVAAAAATTTTTGGAAGAGVGDTGGGKEDSLRSGEATNVLADQDIKSESEHDEDEAKRDLDTMFEEGPEGGREGGEGGAGEGGDPGGDLLEELDQILSDDEDPKAAKEIEPSVAE